MYFQLSDYDQFRRNLRRERNKKAAIKCREKKKKEIDSIIKVKITVIKTKNLHMQHQLSEILHPCHSYSDFMLTEKLGLKQLAQSCTCAHGSSPSRGLRALLSEFHLINATHIFVTQSLHAVHLAGKQKLPISKVFWYDSAKIIRATAGS